VQSVIGQLSNENPQAASSLAVSVSNPDQRNYAIESVARNWLRTDRRSAEAWLAGTTLPDERKRALLGQSNGSQGGIIRID
jgi:hypothetical protein